MATSGQFAGLPKRPAASASDVRTSFGTVATPLRQCPTAPVFDTRAPAETLETSPGRRRYKPTLIARPLTDVSTTPQANKPGSAPKGGEAPGRQPDTGAGRGRGRGRRLALGSRDGGTLCRAVCTTHCTCHGCAPVHPAPPRERGPQSAGADPDLRPGEGTGRRLTDSSVTGR